MKPYELYDIEKERLNSEELEQYEKAIKCCRNESAGGAYGWAAGHEMLIALGWEKTVREEGHRRFIGLVKPAKFSDLVCEEHPSKTMSHNGCTGAGMPNPDLFGEE